MPVMKLYEVELTFRAVVLAESEEEAYSVAESGKYDITRDGDPEVHVRRQITSEKQLPDDWTTDCVPYAAHDENADEHEIGHYLDDPAPEVTRDDKTIDMFAEGA